MIAYNELRAGNYHQGKPISIPKYAISGDGMTAITAYGIYMAELHKIELQPIVLTPELLIKCGFEQTEPYAGCQIYYKEIIGVMFKGGLARGFLMYGYPKYCENYLHLHRLQNLYHSVTGNELVINL